MRFVAGDAEAGGRLDVALAAREEVSSRAEAQRLIDAGRVSVDGSPRPKRHLLSVGEVVEFSLEESEEPSETPEFEVPYEDEHLLVVDKPAGLVVHPAAGHRGPTLAGALAGRAVGGDDPARPGIVQRLDRDTSGLMVVAKSEPAFAAPEGGHRRPRGRPPLPRAGGGAPAVLVGHHRRAAGPRSPPAGAAVHRQRQPQAGDHPLHRGRGAARDHAPRGAPGDRTHPSDPRAPVRDRASGLRRFPLWRRKLRTKTWVNAPIPAQYPARVLSPHIGGTFFVRVQTTRRSASRTRRGPAGASLRRARRRLTVSEAPSGASFAVWGLLSLPAGLGRLATFASLPPLARFTLCGPALLPLPPVDRSHPWTQAGRLSAAPSCVRGLYPAADTANPPGFRRGPCPGIQPGSRARPSGVGPTREHRWQK